MLELLFVIGLTLAAKAAFDHVRDGYQKSKAESVKTAQGKKGGAKLGKSRRAAVVARHAQGFWAGEVLHGFPLARRGWHTGWLAHKAAADHGRAVREEARTSQMETRASVLAGIPEHRKRQAEARRQIEGILTTEPNAKGKKAVRKAAEAVVLRPDFPSPPATDVPPLPAEVGKPEPGPYAPKPDEKPTRRVDGQPETEADKRAFDERESGYDGPLNRDGRRPDMDDPQEAEAVAALDGMRQRAENEPGADAATWSPQTAPLATPSPASNGNDAQRHDRPTGTGGRDIWTEDADWTAVPTESPATNGASTMPATDTTYTEVLKGAQAAVAQSDQDTAQIAARKKAAFDLADAMVAANVDPAVIDAQMQHADNLDKAEKALADAGESASATASSVERYHGGVQEAVDSAPGKIAERQFHEGS